jgi:hypothetical protein
LAVVRLEQHVCGNYDAIEAAARKLGKRFTELRLVPGAKLYDLHTY